MKSLSLLCLGLLLVPFGLGATYDTYQSDYALGASTMDPTGTVVCGATVCDTGTTPGVGGSCPGLVVHHNDSIVVTGTDLGPTDTPLAVCVDSAFDGVCRPENPDDVIFFRCGFASATYQGPSGQLAIFVMTHYQDTNITCGATAGTVEVNITRSGNTGPTPMDPTFYLH